MFVSRPVLAAVHAAVPRRRDARTEAPARRPREPRNPHMRRRPPYDPETTSTRHSERPLNEIHTREVIGPAPRPLRIQDQDPSEE